MESTIKNNLEMDFYISDSITDSQKLDLNIKIENAILFLSLSQCES